MEIGGAESSLLGLMDRFDFENYQVDLFLYSQEGELLSLVNSKVHILKEVGEYKALMEPIRKNIKDGFLCIAVARIFAKIRSKLSKGALHTAHNYKQYFHKLCLPFLPRLEGKYDLAISFSDPHFIIGEKVDAHIKMAWFHTDASRIVFCDRIEDEMWNMSDYVVNVSKDCKNAFDKKHPNLKTQSIVIENILSRELLLYQSKKIDVSSEMKRKKNQILLLSVGRFSHAKNFDNVPDICRRILESGIQVIWYLIGYGGDELLIRRKIEEFGMQEHVIILGKKSNPYPYMKACDVYVQPSRYEGKCVAVREAQILQKPVVITRYATSASQLEDGVDGVIVPMDNQGCAEGIIRLLKDLEYRKQLSRNCAEGEYTNKAEIEKIYACMENMSED